MAKLFQITLPQGMSSVKLDSQRRALVQFTVKNVSAAAIDGRGVLVSLPRTTPPSGAVENNWVKIDGPQERHFDKDREETFAIRVAVPPKSNAGTYSFRLDVVSVPRPDEGDESAAVAFNVAAATVPEGGGFKGILIALVIMLVLVVGVVTTWLIVRKPSKTATQTPPTQSQPQGQGSGPGKSNPLPYGPDTCKQGYVWREANPNDHVCVIPTIRAQTAEDNRLAPMRRSPVGGPYGPDTCLQGYVWRDAFPNDHVCVMGQTRTQAAVDNAQAASRKMQP